MSDGEQAPYEIALANFIVVDDVERSRRFYTEVLGGRAISGGETAYVSLANSWIIINTGGGPTDDKPSVILETPRDPDRADSFLNIRVSDNHPARRLAPVPALAGPAAPYGCGMIQRTEATDWVRRSGCRP